MYFNPHPSKKEPKKVNYNQQPLKQWLYVNACWDSHYKIVLRLSQMLEESDIHFGWHKRPSPDYAADVNRQLSFLPSMQQINQAMILHIQFNTLTSELQHNLLYIHKVHVLSCVTLFLFYSCFNSHTCHDARTAIFRCWSQPGTRTIDLSALKKFFSSAKSSSIACRGHCKGSKANSLTTGVSPYPHAENLWTVTWEFIAKYTNDNSWWDWNSQLERVTKLLIVFFRKTENLENKQTIPSCIENRISFSIKINIQIHIQDVCASRSDALWDSGNDSKLILKQCNIEVITKY